MKEREREVANNKSSPPLLELKILLIFSFGHFVKLLT